MKKVNLREEEKRNHKATNSLKCSKEGISSSAPLVVVFPMYVNTKVLKGSDKFLINNAWL